MARKMKIDPGRYETLGEEIARFDAKMRRPADLGVDLRHATRRMLEELRARKDELQRQHEQLEETRREADRLLLADLLDLYMNGDDGDRQWLRETLHRHRMFRWGIGWGLVDAIAGVEDARRALAVMSMKDGDGDYRDAIVRLDKVSVVMRHAALPVGELLREAAAWSSDVSWLPPMGSMRALLLRRAQRFADRG